MKKLPLLAAAAAAFAILVVPGTFAQTLGPKARIFAKYDTNKNGLIDGDEVAVVRAAYTADPKGEFAVYDTNHDGKLSDEEIAAIKPPGAKGGAKKEDGKLKADTEKKSDDTKKSDAK
jgi:hypothetical protein